MVLWELCTWQLPWGNTNPWQLASFVQRGGRLELPAVEDLPGHDTAAFAASGGLRAYCELMAACWAQDPAQRPSFAELVPCLRWVGVRGLEGVQCSRAGRAGIHQAVSQRLACSAMLLATAVSEWRASSRFVAGSFSTRCLGFEECWEQLSVMLAGPHASHFRGILHSCVCRTACSVAALVWNCLLQPPLLDIVPERCFFKRRSTTVRMGNFFHLAPKPCRTCGFITLNECPERTFLVSLAPRTELHAPNKRNCGRLICNTHSMKRCYKPTAGHCR